jgi:hypothetical protein
MIADNAASKSNSQNSKRCQPVSRNTLKKFSRAEKRLFSILVHLCSGLALSYKQHCHVERSRDIPGKLAAASATGFLDFARNDKRGNLARKIG